MVEIKVRTPDGQPIAQWKRDNQGNLIIPRKNVLQEWVEEISFMQQSVLLTAIRGPDTIHKNHVAKVILRWYRRCILYSAFEKIIFKTPFDLGGGSFTGPCTYDNFNDAINCYLVSLDEIPHHFQLHLMHAVEILGYKHPDTTIRVQWFNFYCRLVNDMHLNIETEEQLNKRLGDNEKDWRNAEEVTAE